MRVLRDAQDDAVVLLLRLRVVMIVVAVLRAVGVGHALLGGRGELLEKMMHPVRRGGGEKKDKHRGHAQEQASSTRHGRASDDHGFGNDLSKVVIEVQVACRAALIDDELDLVACVQFRLVVRRDHAQLQNMYARLDALSVPFPLSNMPTSSPSM